MKPDRRTLIIGIQMLLIIALSWALVFFARDEWRMGAGRDDEAAPRPSRAAIKEGRPTVQLDAKAQRASGIETRAIVPASAPSDTVAYAVVVNPQPLFDLRARYLAARAEVEAARAALTRSSAERDRARALFEDDRNVSQSAVQSAEAARQTDEARLEAARHGADSLAGTLRAEWGPVLAGWAMEPASAEFARLASRNDVLVQAAVLGQAFDPQASRILLAPIESPDKASTARFVSVSPHADPAIQAQTFFYTAPARGLRTGARLAAHVEPPASGEAGVAIPPSAVLWYGGKTWVYVRQDEDDFERREVSVQRETPAGFFNARGFAPNDAVVVTGAQLLLSEELRSPAKADE
jgi:hypothetical protein